ncbi:hypothetical protein ABIB75_005340 [Bradyrhizobium sp. GM2.2]|uniref:hypothetical protein n=1 Tax=Bradyrhizobium sp. GM2.2 TaxID=3156358 RepID=UPI0033984715
MAIMLNRMHFGAACFLVLGSFVPVSGAPLTLQGPADAAGEVVKDALGRPCLEVEAAAIPHVADPSMLDHVVSIRNKCPRLIKAKVCYFGSQTCNDVTASAYKRADTILGTMRGVKFFRYSIKQK